MARHEVTWSPARPGARTGGFVTSASGAAMTPGHALVTDTIQIPGNGLGYFS